MSGEEPTRTQTHLQWAEREKALDREKAARLAGAAAKPDRRIAAGVCGILVGCLGIHKFLLGYTKEGLVMLLVTVLTLGFGAILMGPIGLVEGILYLTKSDEDFVKTYVAGRRGWF